MKLLRRIAITRSLAVFAIVFVLIVFAWVCMRLVNPDGVFPAAVVSGQVDAPAPLLPKPDAVEVARRVDSSAVVIERVRVQVAGRYAATVTVRTEREIVALAVRHTDPGWFHEFRLRRDDPVVVDLLPGSEAEVLTTEQRLPLVDVEFAPHLGLGLSREGAAGIVAVTALRVSGVHLGGYAGAGIQHVSAGGYASIRPRPGWSIGLGFDVLHHDPMFILALNL